MKHWITRCRELLGRRALARLAACILGTAVCLQTAAAPVSAAEGIPEAVSLYINGVSYPGRAFLYENTTYVEFGEFSNQINVCTVETEASTGFAVYSGSGITVRVRDRNTYIEANGRYLWCRYGVFFYEGGIYVPLRAAAKALGADVHWNADEFAAYVSTGLGPILSGDVFYAVDEVRWLSRIICAEAGIEPFLGQIAVGNVVLNRVRSEQFPNTIYSVIFDTRYGVQFTPVANGMVYREADEEAVIAAKLCLEGYTVSEEILYFLNAALAENFWVPKNRPYVMTISGHDFYS